MSHTVAASDIDRLGHVNNAKYLTFLETARWQMMRNNGIDTEEQVRCGLGPVLLKIDLTFKRELHAGDRVRIESRSLSYRHLMFRMSQRILKENGDIAAQAELTLGLFSTSERRLVQPGPLWLSALGLE